jgi:uncharacterized protein (TIGR02453 family)
VASVPGTAPTARFGGFPPEAVAFYQRLELDNTKAFWTANRDVYERAVRAPLVALTGELADEFGPFHLFRPHRDVRFSADKSPYKTHQGAVTEGEGGEAYYLHLGPDGLFVGTGYHEMARDQLARFRDAIVDEDAGSDLAQRVAALERRGYELGGEALKTAPRGYPRDHPRVRLLRFKGITARRSFGTPSWLSTRRTRTRVVEAWRGAWPLDEWLIAHVGPSEEPPEDRW